MTELEQRRPLVHVVSGVFVWQTRVLLQQRRGDDVFPLLWETPGGKVESGETLRIAVLRELNEELDWSDADAVDLGPFYRGDFLEQNPPIAIHFFLVKLRGRTLRRPPALNAAVGAGWFLLEETRTLSLIPGAERLLSDPRAVMAMRL